MQLSTITLIAAAIAQVLAQEHSSEWVTYTKKFSYTTFVVTKYLGSTGLTGSSYTTRTIDVTDENGSVMYTEVATGRADAVASGNSAANSSASSSAEEGSSTAATSSSSEESSSSEDPSSSAEETSSSSSDSSSSSTEASSSSEAGAGKVAGYSLGALAVGAAALLL